MYQFTQMQLNSNKVSKQHKSKGMNALCNVSCIFFILGMKVETSFELNVKKPEPYQIITTCNNENKIVLNGLANWYLINGLCPYCLKKITAIGNFTIELNNLCTCKNINYEK